MSENCTRNGKVFEGKNLVSVEKSAARSSGEEDTKDEKMSRREQDAFLQWIQLTLGSKKVPSLSREKAHLLKYLMSYLASSFPRIDM